MNKKAKREKLLYYYCSVDTFLKIMENRTLMLSDPSKMNDTEEFHQAIKILKKMVSGKEFSQIRTELISQLPNGWSIEEVKSLNRQALLYHLEAVSKAIEDYSNLCVFIVCFSGNGDLLSQWHKYADSATGLAIGFNKKTLFKGKSHVTLCNVIYVSDNIEAEITTKQYRVLTEILRDMLSIIGYKYEQDANDESLDSSSESLDSSSESLYSSPESLYSSPWIYSADYIDEKNVWYAAINSVNTAPELNGDIYKIVKNTLKKYLTGKSPDSQDMSQISPLDLCILTPHLLARLLKIKNEGFKEECETRAILCLNEQLLTKYTKGIRKVVCNDRDTFTPYITMEFDSSDVVDIVIGPKCQVTTRDIEQLLLILSLNSAVENSHRDIEIDVETNCTKNDLDISVKGDIFKKIKANVRRSKTGFR